VEIGRVGVVGLGTMGAGIAQVCLQAGLEVVGREVSPELGEKARARIDHYLSRGVEKSRLTQKEKDAALDRLTLVTELADLGSCQLVIEAAFEDLEVKRELFGELERSVEPEAILATNTSALSVTEIAAATTSPERVVGMHFFNPAPVLPLVEVIRTAHTSDEIFDTAYAFAERIGKEPVACNDTPGFIVNRILIPLLNRAMRFGVNWPIGPCALIDLIGIDVHVHASEALHAALGEERMAPPERLIQMQQAGHLGRKSGRGFYEYDAS